MASSSSGNQGAATAKHLRVLLPFSRDALRITDELAGEIAAAEALIVGAAGGKVKFWPVEVGKDGDGAFLGRGWPEFAEACGAGAGWSLVLRHRGRGVLSAKAFDATCCLRVPGAPAPPAVEGTNNKGSTHKPQFIRALTKDSMEKMLIPAEFVQQYIPIELLDNRAAIVLGPSGKVHNINLEMGMREAWCLLSSLKVYGSNGYQRVSKHKETIGRQNIEEHQEAPSASIQKQQRPPSASIQKQQEAIPASIQRQQRTPSASIQEQQEAPPASIQKQYVNDLPSSNVEKEPQGPTASLNQTSSKIGPPSSIEKQINADTLKNHIVLPKAFCDSIGLRESCAITLKTSRNGSKFWQVHGIPCKNSYQLGKGWRRFCQENSLKEGDICTFSVIESTIWHVIITHSQTITDAQEQHGTPFASSRKRKRRNDSSSSDDDNKQKVSMTLKNASTRAEGVYEIGPPAWIKKEINTRMVNKCISLPAAFCDGIGLREACTVTLKTSLSSTSSWQVRVLPYKNTSHQVGSGWKTFCQENKIKEGDVCTFNIIEIKLWLVIIERC